MDFDVELMAETSERISASVSKQIESLVNSHGVDFAYSVLGNVGCFLLTCLLASEVEDDERVLKLFTIMQVLAVNVKNESAHYQASEIIDRIKKGSKC